MQLELEYQVLIKMVRVVGDLRQFMVSISCDGESVYEQLEADQEAAFRTATAYLHWKNLNE